MILHSIETPADVKGLSYEELDELCAEIRAFIVDTVTTTGGHLGSNLGRGRADAGAAQGLRLAA